MACPSVSVIGGAGFVGTKITKALADTGRNVIIIDRTAPADQYGTSTTTCDVLVDPVTLPADGGGAVLAHGESNPRHQRPWQIPLANVISTARILPQLAGRDIVLLSSVEVYGAADGLLIEDTEPILPCLDLVEEWAEEAKQLAASPCPPHRVAAFCRTFADADPTGRWIYALSKLTQERLVRHVVPADRLTVLRLANVVGLGQERLISRLARRALAGLPLLLSAGVRRSFVPVQTVAGLVAADVGPGTFNVGADPISLDDLARQIQCLCGTDVPVVSKTVDDSDSSGLVSSARLNRKGYRVPPVSEYLPALIGHIRDHDQKIFQPNLQVVVPPRPERPDLMVTRQQELLETGRIKHGNRWTLQLHEELATELSLTDDQQVVATTSGTAALRLAVAAIAGPAKHGAVAVLPSFTFPATAEVLVQLGYELRYADIDPVTWTIDPDRLPALLAGGDVGVVVGVDTFGLPCDYVRVRDVCAAAGVPFIADSAAALGSRYRGRPVSGWADGHAYSMSFAKVLSAGGAGGALVLPREAMERLYKDPAGWTRSELMTEQHAVVALDQLPQLERMTVRRGRLAAIYREVIEGRPVLSTQLPRPGDRHSYVHWVVRTPCRNLVQDRLLRLGIETKPYFPAMHHAITASRQAGHRLPVTDQLHAETLALPMSSEMDEPQAEASAFALSRIVDDLLASNELERPTVPVAP